MKRRQQVFQETCHNTVVTASTTTNCHIRKAVNVNVVPYAIQAYIVSHSSSPEAGLGLGKGCRSFYSKKKGTE